MAETNACLRNLDIEIPAGEVEREYTRIAQDIQRRAKIPGFRPGKAPLTLVRQHFGPKIREEMLETLVPAHLRAAFERESLEPVSTPTVDELDYQPGTAVKFKTSFEVMPPIELGDYKSIRIENPPVTVSQEDVDKTLAALREQHSSREDSDAAELSDGLVGVVEATRLPENENKEENQDGDASATEGAKQGEARDESAAQPEGELPIEVGGADTLPEFSTALRGMKPGEERDLEVSYPAEYPNPAFAGKTQRYHLKLNRIQRKIVPELTDEFVKSSTGVETLTELRQRIETNLRADREHEARHKAEDQVLDQLLAASEFPVPRALVEKQVDAKLERNLRGLAEQGVDPRRLKVDWSKLRDKHADSAEREVKAALLLDKIAEAEKIEASPESVDAEIELAATEMKQSAEALRARLVQNGAIERIKNRLRQEAVLTFLIQNASSSSPGLPAGQPAADPTKESAAL